MGDKSKMPQTRKACADRKNKIVLWNDIGHKPNGLGSM